MKNGKAGRPAPDYLTYPLCFDTWRWYKPLLTGLMVLALTAVSIIAASALLVFLGVRAPERGTEAFAVYGALMSEYLSAAELLWLFLASKAVKDRPFSSYASSRGGWNGKLFFRCLGLSLALWAVVFAAVMLLSRQPFSPVGKDAPAVLALIVLLMPLTGIGSAFETGFVGQTFASWFRKPAAGIAAAALIQLLSSWGSGPLGRIASLAAALCAVCLAWRTKGAEAGAAFLTGRSLCLFFLSGPGAGAADMSSLQVAGVLSASVLYFLLIEWLGERKLRWLSAAEREEAPARRKNR